MPQDIEIVASLVRCTALVLLASAAAAQCSVDEDCGLLGTCAAGACACEPGWTGTTCASLDLLPAPPDAGLRQANSSNWCLTLLRDEADPDLVHAYSADFGGCTNGLNIWLTGSRVIHATGRGGSSGPAVGPFAPAWGDGDAEVAVAAEAHNPTAIRAPDGTFLLMDCAETAHSKQLLGLNHPLTRLPLPRAAYNGPDAGCNMQANYSTCTGKSMCPPKMPSGGGLGTFVYHFSTSARGPWEPVNVSMDYPCFSENLTPAPFFHPNGTMFIVFHCDTGGSHKMGDLVMVRSDSWRGPFSRVNDGIWAVGNVAPHPEDPTLFIHTNSFTGDISWHVVMHNTPVGIHLFSRDGLTFTLQQALSAANEPQPPFVYPALVQQTDGTNFTADRRERPWMMMKRGTASVPEVLVTSMDARAAFPYVFSHAQAVRS